MGPLLITTSVGEPPDKNLLNPVYVGIPTTNIGTNYSVNVVCTPITLRNIRCIVPTKRPKCGLNPPNVD